MNAFELIAEMLHERCGFSLAHPGAETLRRIVHERSEGRTPEDYYHRLRHSSEEFSALVRDVIVPETFFLRHKESFQALAEWVVKRPTRPLHILSLACSTGEEPYSIAITLLEAGMAATDFDVSAWDLSADNIATAKRGLYTANSFRGRDLSWQETYFRGDGPGWKIRPDIRRLVNFRVANLLELDVTASFDAIFCRNVLIYFSSAQQQNVAARIERALCDDGILFLGPAEPPTFLARGWASAPYPMSFTCVKGTEKTSARFTRPQSAISSRAVVRPLPVAKPAVTPKPQAAKPISLDEVRAMADSGRLDEARDFLQKFLNESPDDANGHFLLGLVEETGGKDAAAEASYRSAIYLQPSHVEALQHMALLLSRQGRTEAARNLRRRAGLHGAQS